MESLFVFLNGSVWGSLTALTAHRFAADQNHTIGQQGAAMRRKRWCCDSSAFKGR